MTNTGRVSLASVDLALTLKTDKETYREEFRTSLDLPAGKLAYGSVEFGYRAPEETSGLPGLTVDSVAFH